MGKGERNSSKVVILILVILIAFALLAKRTFFRGPVGGNLTSEQKAERERWTNMTEEEKEIEIRKEMEEMGLSPEEIENLMRQDEEIRKDVEEMGNQSEKNNSK